MAACYIHIMYRCDDCRYADVYGRNCRNGLLFPIIQRKDPENNNHWIDVFRAEKRYRQLKAKLPSMKAELLNMEVISDNIL